MTQPDGGGIKAEKDEIYTKKKGRRIEAFTYVLITKPFNATVQKTRLTNRNRYITLYFKIKIRLFAISGCHNAHCRCCWYCCCDYTTVTSDAIVNIVVVVVAAAVVRLWLVKTKCF